MKSYNVFAVVAVVLGSAACSGAYKFDGDLDININDKTKTGGSAGSSNEEGGMAGSAGTSGGGGVSAGNSGSSGGGGESTCWHPFDQKPCIAVTECGEIPGHYECWMGTIICIEHEPCFTEGGGAGNGGSAGSGTAGIAGAGSCNNSPLLGEFCMWGHGVCSVLPYTYFCGTDGNLFCWPGENAEYPPEHSLNEVCGDSLDNDCNGKVDDGCGAGGSSGAGGSGTAGSGGSSESCKEQEQRRCYIECTDVGNPNPAATDGTVIYGLQTCTNGEWEKCKSEEDCKYLKPGCKPGEKTYCSYLCTNGGVVEGQRFCLSQTLTPSTFCVPYDDETMCENDACEEAGVKEPCEVKCYEGVSSHVEKGERMCTDYGPYGLHWGYCYTGKACDKAP